MKNPFEKILERAGAHVSLTPEEREKMRYVLREYMAFAPKRAPAPTLVERFYRATARPLPAAVALVLMLMLSSGGIAYAAEGALPGDLLYPVKVDVTEPARGLLATTPAAKADWHITLAERRLDEAATLAARDTLSTTTEASLAAQFTTNVRDARAALAALATTSPADASVSATTLAIRLSAYNSVLARLGRTHDATTTILRDSIAAETRAVNALAVAPQGTKETAATSSEGQGQIALSEVERLSSSVNQALAISASVLGQNEKLLNATTSASARDEYAHATALASRAQDLLHKGDSEGAQQALEDSLATTARLEVYTRAAANFKIDLFSASTTASTTATSTEATSTSSTTSPTETASSTASTTVSESGRRSSHAERGGGSESASVLESVPALLTR